MYPYSPKDKVREVTTWPGRVIKEKGEAILYEAYEGPGVFFLPRLFGGSTILATGHIAELIGQGVALGVNGGLWVFGSRDGVPIRPDPMTINAERAKEKFEEGRIHIAVCGQSGSGKSSIVNALQGIPNSQVGAAPTGTTETTEMRLTYRAHESIPSTTLHDLPGGGTRRTPIENYYRSQNLQLFDLLLVVHAGRLGQLDIEIVRNCIRIRQPFLIVRSKSDESINAIINDTGLAQEAAKLKHVKTTLAALSTEFVQSGVPKEIVGPLVAQSIIVNNQALRNCVLDQGQSSINELELVNFLREFTTYFQDGRMKAKWWLKQVESGKYFDEQYIGDIEMPNNRFLLVTYNQILLVHSRYLTCDWNLPFQHIQSITKEEAGIKIMLTGGANWPLIPVECRIKRTMLFGILGVAVERENLRRQ